MESLVAVLGTELASAVEYEFEELAAVYGVETAAADYANSVEYVTAVFWAVVAVAVSVAVGAVKNKQLNW